MFKENINLLLKWKILSCQKVNELIHGFEMRRKKFEEKLRFFASFSLERMTDKNDDKRMCVHHKHNIIRNFVFSCVYGNQHTEFATFLTRVKSRIEEKIIWIRTNAKRNSVSFSLRPFMPFNIGLIRHQIKNDENLLFCSCLNAILNAISIWMSTPPSPLVCIQQRFETQRTVKWFKHVRGFFFSFQKKRAKKRWN